MKDELTIELQYQPAWSFAERAKRSCQEASTLSTPFKIGDPALLALLYSSFALEAFVDEELLKRVTEAQYTPLYSRDISATSRWMRAATLVCASTNPDSVIAQQQLRGECQDKGNYGLLVRMHIPVEGDHPFQSKATTDSDLKATTLGWRAGMVVAFPGMPVAIPGMVVAIRRKL